MAAAFNNNNHSSDSEVSEPDYREAPGVAYDNGGLHVTIIEAIEHLQDKVPGFFLRERWDKTFEDTCVECGAILDAGVTPNQTCFYSRTYMGILLVDRLWKNIFGALTGASPWKPLLSDPQLRRHEANGCEDAVEDWADIRWMFTAQGGFDELLVAEFDWEDEVELDWI